MIIPTTFRMAKKGNNRGNATKVAKTWSKKTAKKKSQEKRSKKRAKKNITKDRLTGEVKGTLHIPSTRQNMEGISFGHQKLFNRSIPKKEIDSDEQGSGKDGTDASSYASVSVSRDQDETAVFKERTKTEAQVKLKDT